MCVQFREKSGIFRSSHTDMWSLSAPQYFRMTVVLQGLRKISLSNLSNFILWVLREKPHLLPSKESWGNLKWKSAAVIFEVSSLPLKLFHGFLYIYCSNHRISMTTILTNALWTTLLHNTFTMLQMIKPLCWFPSIIFGVRNYSLWCLLRTGREG